MKKTFYALLLLITITASFSFMQFNFSNNCNKEGAMFISDEKKAVLVLNIRDLINDHSPSERLIKFEQGFFKGIQSTLSKEGYF